ncbi:MAG: hypothetical protein PHY54_09310 [Methylococcales bacterium]|nr:hypothetical protein [Methylococcales bacterium]
MKDTITMSNYLVIKLIKIKINKSILKTAIFLLYSILYFFVPLKSVVAVETNECKNSDCSPLVMESKPVDSDSIRRGNLDKAFRSYAAPGYQLMLWGADIPRQPYYGEKYTEVEYTRKLNEYIGNGLSQIVATPEDKLVKDEFETTQAFELRKKENDKKYNAKIKEKESQADQQRSVVYSDGFQAVLGSPTLVSEYDADKETFNLAISSPWAKYDIKAKIKVVLAEAKETKAKMESMIPWVVFQIYPEKVIPRGVILQNKKGDASSIKRIDFIDMQDSQSISIGHNAYLDALSARKEADKLAIQQKHQAEAKSSQSTENTAMNNARANNIGIVGEWLCKRPSLPSMMMVITFLPDGRFAETVDDPTLGRRLSTGRYSLDDLSLNLDYGDVSATWYVTTVNGESVKTTPTTSMGMVNPSGGSSTSYICNRT